MEWLDLRNAATNREYYHRLGRNAVMTGVLAAAATIAVAGGDGVLPQAWRVVVPAAALFGLGVAVISAIVQFNAIPPPEGYPWERGTLVEAQSTMASR
jgi:hypothetical protein